MRIIWINQNPQSGRNSSNRVKHWRFLNRGDKPAIRGYGDNSFPGRFHLIMDNFLEKLNFTGMRDFL